MKKLIYLLTVSLFLSCNSSKDQPKESAPITKKWLDKTLDFRHIVEGLNRFQMFDSTGQAVGQMDFGTAFENGKLMIRDTSQFYDGSVYETATFAIDTTAMRTELYDIDMRYGETNMTADLKLDSNRLIGNFNVLHASNERKIPIDSALNYDIARIEIYALLHALDWQIGDSINLSAFVPLSFSVAQASLNAIAEDTVNLPQGTYPCIKVALRADGKMPDNDIWITKEEPRKIVKFFIPQQQLEIKLMSSI